MAGRIALTFDDGPSRWTPAVLDVLASHAARATFFVLGQAVEKHADIVRRTLAEGHEIGNHTQTHPWPPNVGDDELRRELEQANAAIERAIGIVPRLVRPPHGRDPERFAHIANELGFEGSVLWTVDPEDWNSEDADAIARFVLDRVEPGANILLHDGILPRESFRASCTATVEAVGAILDALEDYEFVTVSEL